MKLRTLRRQHKWFGIIICFFMLMFCLSGIVLNHRDAVSDMNVSRGCLPGRYHYHKWNGGLMRGTIPYTSASVLIYGNSGIWLADSSGSAVSDFNAGLPQGADFRQIRSVVKTPSGQLLAVSILGLYRYDAEALRWRPVPIPKGEDELLADAVCRNDSLIVAGRSYLYTATAPYTRFARIELKQPADYKGDVTLFRTVWMLHSGELFGLPGRIFVDAIAVILIVICVTGVMFWLLPKYIRRRRERGATAGNAQRLSRFSLLWHDKLGRYTLIFTLFIAVTGWCLRPPVMIPLALTRVPALPASTLDSDNPWNNKLRMIRYDARSGEWLLSTSEGFYSLKNLRSVPVRIAQAPPVSVMGLNVFQRNDTGQWLCGSFSGLYLWDREENRITDYFTGEAAEPVAGPPFGRRAVSGFSCDFSAGPFPVEYYEGTDAVPQPAEMNTLPMSLWNFALEVHSGRIFIGNAATYVYIFLTGLGAVWCLWTGWKIRRRKNRP